VFFFSKVGFHLHHKWDENALIDTYKDVENM